MFFTSKKDIVYSLICWGTVILTSLAIIFNFSLSVLPVFSTILGLLAIVLLIWVWFGTNYKVEDKSIQISYGPLKKRSPYRI